jgi:transcriptional regulator with XRE-family HTH domain
MKENKEYWQEFLERYRVSKMIREIRKKLNINQTELGRITGFSKQYVNNVQEMTIKPSEEFIKKLEQLKNFK